MPLRHYDRFFGGRTDAAARALAGMQRTYGADEGERVFYATLEKRRAQGNGNGIAHLLTQRKQQR